MMAQFIVTDPTAIPKKLSEKENYFSVYPNPAGNRLNLKLNNPDYKVYYLSINTVSGRTVLMSPFPDLSNGLDISFLNPGVYTVQVTDNDSKATFYQKFVKAAGN